MRDAPEDRAELLEQFAIETEQHIGQIEPLLLAAEWDPPDKAAVGTLFRCFHSVKGLSRLLDFRGLEEVTHHAETLLGHVRAERQGFTPAVQDVLLRALDAIRDLRAHGITTGQDSPAEPALLVALAAAADDAPAAGRAPDAQDAADAPLHDDADTLAYFAEMMAECLPGLCPLAGGPGGRDQAEEDLASLSRAAGRLALHGLRDRIDRLGESDAETAIDAMAGLIHGAGLLAALLGQDTGADALRQRMAPALQKARAREIAQLGRDQGTGGAPLASARRLLRLDRAADPFSAAAPLLVAAIEAAPWPAESQVPVAVSGLVSVLAEGLAQPAGGVSDMLGLACSRLQGLLAAATALSGPVLCLLAERAVDAARLGPLAGTSAANLALALDGGERRLVIVTAPVPAGPEEAPAGPEGDAVLAGLASQLGVVAAQAARLEGGPAVVVMAVAGMPPDALRANLAATGIEVQALDGQVQDHAWAPAPVKAPRLSREPDDNQVRVPVEILDRLFGRIGEFFNISSALNVLMVDGQVRQTLQRLNDHVLLKEPSLLPGLDALQRQQDELRQIETEVSRLVSLIHEATLGLRVIPLDTLFNRYPRMIRDLLREVGKQARFEVTSDGIKIDKGMTELLADPLMHMLRNAVDHGLEPPAARLAAGKPAAGRLTLSATQNANRITVVISDDGRGIDAELVRRHAVTQNLVTEAESHRLPREQIHRLIFAPGFSTAAKVTGTSGRGVGMDVALVNISRLGGRIDIVTVPGQGTQFRLDMPLSAAMQTVLLAETSVQTVAFPERMVVEAVTVGQERVQFVNGQRALLLHDRFLPLFRLTDLLRLPDGGGAPAPEGGELSLVVVAAGTVRFGVEVDRILRRHEMLIRDTHPRIAQLPGIGGVSTLGADRIVLVVDPEGLADLARSAALPGLRSAAAVPDAPAVLLTAE